MKLVARFGGEGTQWPDLELRWMRAEPGEMQVVPEFWVDGKPTPIDWTTVERHAEFFERAFRWVCERWAAIAASFKHLRDTQP